MKLRFLTLAGIVFAAALSRLMPHPWNVTPVAAIALFGGAHFAGKWSRFLVPLAALLLSDLVLGFYPTVYLTYAAFAIIVVIGLRLKNNAGATSVMSASLMGSVVFFLVTNFGHWLVMADYAKNPAGLLACYTAALPFFRNSLLGDLFYSGVLFGSFSLLQKRFSVLRPITI